MRGGTPQNRKTSTHKKRYPCLQRRKVIPRNRILILRFHFFTFLQQLFQVRVFGYSTIKRLGNRLSPTIFFTAFSLPLPASGRLWGGVGFIHKKNPTCPEIYSVRLGFLINSTRHQSLRQLADCGQGRGAYAFPALPSTFWVLCI